MAALLPRCHHQLVNQNHSSPSDPAGGEASSTHPLTRKAWPIVLALCGDGSRRPPHATCSLAVRFGWPSRPRKLTSLWSSRPRSAPLHQMLPLSAQSLDDAVLIKRAPPPPSPVLRLTE